MSIKVVNNDLQDQPATDNPAWKVVVEIVIGAVCIAVTFVAVFMMFKDVTP